MQNHITFDIEYWYHRPPFRHLRRDQAKADSHLNHSVELILDLLRQHDCESTFFVVGEVAEANPEIVRRIESEGHEIAFHGYSHFKIGQLGRPRFSEELAHGMTLLSRIAAAKVVGFRAPMFSLNRRTAWAVDELVKNKFGYDSSIFPAYTGTYGSNKAPTRPYLMTGDNPYDEARGDGGIVEFPITVAEFGNFRLPAGGGLWLRLLGEKFTLSVARRNNRAGKECVLYFHPWEITQFAYQGSQPAKFYGNLGVPILKQLSRLIKEIGSSSLRDSEYYKNNPSPPRPSI